MHRSQGFTLIELLLVLAIIGILSGIAIPVLVDLRTKARDRACIANVTGQLADLVGRFEQAKDLDLTDPQITTVMNTYLAQRLGATQSPWGTGPAFNTTLRPPIVGAQGTTEFEAQMVPNAVLGKVRVYIQYPSNGDPGFIGMVVRVSKAVNGSTTVARSTSI